MLIFVVLFLGLVFCKKSKEKGDKKLEFDNEDCDDKTKECPNLDLGNTKEDFGLKFKYLELVEVKRDGTEVMIGNIKKSVDKLPKDWTVADKPKDGVKYKSQEVSFKGTLDKICPWQDCKKTIFESYNFFVLEGSMEIEDKNHTKTVIGEGKVKTTMVIKNWPFASNDNFLKVRWEVYGRNLQKPVTATQDGAVVTLSSPKGVIVIDFVGKVVVDGKESDVTIVVEDNTEKDNKAYVSIKFPAGTVINYDPIMDLAPGSSGHVLKFGLFVLFLLFLF